MYAVIETGGKQYRVAEGQTLRVEKLPGAKGESVVFDRVLLLNDGTEVKVGQPYLDGCTWNKVIRARPQDHRLQV